VADFSKDSIPGSDDLEEKFESYLPKEAKLSALAELSTVFTSGDPQKGHVHVVVRIPETSELHGYLSLRFSQSILSL